MFLIPSPAPGTSTCHLRQKRAPWPPEAKIFFSPDPLFPWIIFLPLNIEMFIHYITAQEALAADNFAN
jgi:hypothetical protein